MKEFFKCIFVPFYWFHKSENDTAQEVASIFYGIFLSMYIIVRFSMGVTDANDPKECRATSIGDIMIAPMYTLGCNIGKDRFEVKLN